MDAIRSVGCDIFFGEPAYAELNALMASKKYSSVFLLTDDNTNESCAPLFLPMLECSAPIEIIEIEAGERQKQLETCAEVWQIMNDYGADRKSVVINLGGGMISDLGGFAASVYKRGIDFINVPTSLLGMVDAAIGGKNGIDFGGLKNMIGTITSPQMILIDDRFLWTLPPADIRSGLAEMLKHGLIADRSHWERLKGFEVGAEIPAGLIGESITIKNEIVMRDPTENGIRKALNFGHTLGHAIESHLLNRGAGILHGEAVAAGMVLEGFLSWRAGTIASGDYLDIRETILSLFGRISFTGPDIDAIIALLAHDKKNEYGRILFVLLEGIGRVALDRQAGNGTIREAFKDYLSE